MVIPSAPAILYFDYLKVRLIEIVAFKHFSKQIFYTILFPLFTARSARTSSYLVFHTNSLMIAKLSCFLRSSHLLTPPKLFKILIVQSFVTVSIVTTMTSADFHDSPSCRHDRCAGLLSTPTTPSRSPGKSENFPHVTARFTV